MIKKIRILILIFFLVVTAVFGYSKVTAAMDADTQAPVISATADTIEVSVDADDSELLQGLTATDNRDGDVSDSLVVVSRTKFITTGEVNINYAAFDSHNNVGTYTRRVVYTDYTSPEFSAESPLVFRTSDTYPDYLEGITATDVLDGDLTSMIRMSYGYSGTTNEDGTYTLPLTIQVTNTAGDTSSLELEVSFLDDKTYSEDAPALSQYLVYTDAGDEITPSDYISGIRNGTTVRDFEDSSYAIGDITYDDSTVDYNTPGVYQITYTLNQTLENSYYTPTPTPTPEAEDEDESEYVDEDHDGFDDVTGDVIPDEDREFTDEDEDGYDDISGDLIPEGWEADTDEDAVTAEAVEDYTAVTDEEIIEELGTSTLFVVVR